MATAWHGGEPSKPELILNGKKIIIENCQVIDLNAKYSKGLTYRRETVLHFKNEDEANEYYYKNR